MRTVYNICMVMALFCVLVAGAHAITVDVSVYKHNFTSNETIPYNVTGLMDGVNFSQKTTFYQAMKPGEASSLGLNAIVWPFSHKDDVFNMTNINTTENSVYIGHWWPPAKGGSYEALNFNGTSANIVDSDGTVVSGTWNRTYHYEYDQTGTYTSRWNATPMPGATIVTSIFWINGTKLTGPNDFAGNTSVWSANPALVQVDYYENNVPAAHDWFTIDMAGAISPTLAPGSSSGSSDSGSSYGTIGTSAASSGSGSGSGSGSSGSGSSGTAVATTVGAGVTGTATPVGTPTFESSEASAATPTPTPTGMPFAFAAVGALGCAALLISGRVRR